MFENCLICTDFTHGLYRLVNFVPQLASSGLKRIVFLHSVSVWEEGKVARVDESLIRESQEKLAPALSAVPEGVEVEIEVPSGQIVDSILRSLETHAIDVILTSSSVRSGLETKIFGSNTLELARATPIPLLIFRPQLISTYTCEELALRCQHLWRYLLVPYNDSKAARYLLEELKAHAPNRQSWQKCFLLWVIDDGGRQEDLTRHRMEEARQKLTEVKAQLQAFGLEVNAEVRQGNPIHEILDAALHHDISAIAIASDYRSNILEWTVPSVAQEIIARSWFPLLYFSPKK